MSVLHSAICQCSRSYKFVLYLSCCLFSSFKQEKEVIEYIASEIGVNASEIVVPEFICSTCFNFLREQFFGIFLTEK